MLAGFLASFSSKESKESTPQLFSVDIRYITSVYTRWADSSVTFPHPVKIFLTQASSRPIVGTLLAPIGYFLPVRPLLASAQQKQVRSSSRHKPKAGSQTQSETLSCAVLADSQTLAHHLRPPAGRLVPGKIILPPQTVGYVLAFPGDDLQAVSRFGALIGRARRKSAS
ncbi:uncharacterized protein K444DRAFT_152347 [Hyaloscypha bicolor E]|uniref:Uncharacterized protein n=1 Tax=Hyaloscypha bicolor E TaxID=1095630 RepID=A0A2J6TS01_9HELO|nr:uncharacterized protein K444DRAFT_152347 [Hyaloscypha bicolor E]PMD65782.1 hypothetical protein K444DRAFT_152347 [Hyaloscypha bicolor E]